MHPLKSHERLRRRPVAAALVILLPACVLAGCGGGGTSDEDQIRQALERMYASSDASACRELATRRFLAQSTLRRGQLALDACRGRAKAEKVSISRVDVQGDEARARVVPKGGDADGQRLLVGLVKRDGGWKLAEIVDVALDRTRYDGALAARLARGPDALSQGQAQCAVESLRRLSDSELEQATIDGSGALLRRPVARCRIAVSPEAGTLGGTQPATGLRAAFETALERKLRRQQKLTQAQARCIADRLGATLSDAQIRAVVRGHISRAVSQAAARAGAVCVSR